MLIVLELALWAIGIGVTIALHGIFFAILIIGGLIRIIVAVAMHISDRKHQEALVRECHQRDLEFEREMYRKDNEGRAQLKRIEQRLIENTYSERPYFLESKNNTSSPQPTTNTSYVPSYRYDVVQDDGGLVKVDKDEVIDSEPVVWERPAMILKY